MGGFKGSQIQTSVEAFKRLNRLSPTFGTCLRIRLGMITNLSLEKLPNGWTDWHQIRNTSVDSSVNGHRLKTIRPTIPHGGKNLRNVAKRLDRFGINFAHIIWEWTQVEQIGPMRHQGEHFDAGLSRGNVLGFNGVNISSKVWGMPRCAEKTN